MPASYRPTALGLSSTDSAHDAHRKSSAVLELPSISQVHFRGSVDSSWYTNQFAPRPTVSSERLPALPQIQAGTASSTSSSPRGGSISSASALNSSASSHTSYSSSVNGSHSGFKTPSPEQAPQSLGRDTHPLNGQSQESPFGQQQSSSSYGYAGDSYGSMNQMQSYPDVHQPHMPAPGHAPSSGPPSTLGHYSGYQHPPYLQHGPSSSMVQSSFYQSSYGNGVPPTPSSTTMTSALVPQSLPLPAMTAGGPGAPAVPGSQGYPPTHQFDTSGQIAPPGMKPRVTATLWEDEGSLCFQVEAKGVCVARREDNHMINGTKLLNVAGMTRGRRDGILKSEKTRHVVKIGPMHLKGVWIPFERALDFANKEKITEQLYPLFVHDIGALLYHPTNQRNSVGAGNAMAAAMDRRRPDSQQQRYIGAPQSSQPTSLHHHSMSNPSMPSQIQSSPHTIAPHPSAGRPSIDRAHTFPTPPTSASSIIGMGSSGSSYEWGNPGVSSMQGNQPLSIDTSLSNARSVPTTPATTPPGTMQSMQQYPTTQAYDGTRQMYSAAPSQPGQYSAQQTMARYGQPVQPNPYAKSEMAPPARTGGEPVQQTDSKPTDAMLSQSTEPVGQVIGEVEEADHEHDNEYTHTSGPYSNRNTYGYATSSAPGTLSGEHASPDMTGSPHHNGSGRATPRTTTTSQTQWSRGYGTPGKTLPSSNLYSVISDTRSTANGSGPDGYGAPSLQTGYPSQYAPNGALPSAKRIRDLDDDENDYGRPASRDANGNEVEGLKRRKTITENTIGGAVGGLGGVGGDLKRTNTTIAQRRR
ncbi:uncharacterized protein K452DRAFT_293859 [Aplosporella prunicola CBS 121167]|uniref:HTH APSES-type domain-containing protein n=1 Tax=Aplosporella prunicola CBS 121167 TaxID=1176127 RepID=A0A6A6BX02_9PEZI|nr:uncharacterized protein K452DRAFT_293859 [Aplosporella prunicola CBS 121167]KAF2147437.1 hypothetical protein K452DRAFT_293859 [Aplosporella prunicola CBS 121167]